MLFAYAIDYQPCFGPESIACLQDNVKTICLALLQALSWHKLNHNPFSTPLSGITYRSNDILIQMFPKISYNGCGALYHT